MQTTVCWSNNPWNPPEQAVCSLCTRKSWRLLVQQPRQRALRALCQGYPLCQSGSFRLHLHLTVMHSKCCTTVPSMASMHAPAQHITASTASPGPAADAQWLQSMQTSPQGASSHRGSSRSLSPELAHQPERVLIVKGHPARLATQSEQFANELSQHLGICAPACRILRKLVCDAPSHHEW